MDRIYLNFSDPWPKDRHAKRRLPSKEFLRRFAQILTPDGTIEFKTDNRALFDFAVEEVEAGGFKILAITYDLHSDPVMNEGNIMTEYEERFSAKGNPIEGDSVRAYTACREMYREGRNLEYEKVYDAITGNAVMRYDQYFSSADSCFGRRK